MQETWKGFVYPLIEDKRLDVEEETYHRHIENQLMLLGWEPWKGEIIHKQSLRIGNRNRMEPDILVARDGEYQFVIEVKRPGNTQTKEEITQLESYMRQLRLDVGIYVGEYIELFYDKPNSNHVVSVFRLAIDLEEKRGTRFVELFSKEKFTKAEVVAFCEERLQEMERQASLNKIKESLIANAQTQIAESLLPYLMEKYGGGFSEEDMRGMLSRLHFSINAENSVLPQTQQEIKQDITNKIAPETTKKREYDYTEYSIEGGQFLGKNKFVYAAVSLYVKQHPNATFADLEKAFPPELQGSFGVIRTMEYIKEKNYNGRRYFKEPEYVLHSGDNIPFAVSTEWGKGNIEKFVKAVKQLGYHVETTADANTNNETDSTNEKNVSEGKLFHINIRGCNAKGIFDETNHSMRILKGSLLPQSTAASAAIFLAT